MHLRASSRLLSALKAVPRRVPGFTSPVPLSAPILATRLYTASTLSASTKSFKDEILQKGEDWINGKKLKERFPWAQLETAKGDSMRNLVAAQGHFKSGNDVEGIKSLKLSADEGFTEAMSLLGMCYWRGTGVEKNFEEAARYIQMAADQGHGHAHYVLGKTQSSQGNTEQAKKHFLTAVEQHCYEAHYSLAACYLASEQDTDIEAGLAQLELASKFPQSSDYVTARYHIGLIHNYSMHGVKEDTRAAFVHFQAAAERQHRESQHELGNCYIQGRGVEKDVNKGVEYFRLAAEQGYSQAQLMLARCYLHGTGVPRDSAQCLHLTKLAADQANPEALCDLGVMYYTGTVVSIDQYKAFGLFKQAAELNSPRGLGSVAECYYHGHGVSASLNSAVEYHTRAAQLNYPPSLWMLGRLHEVGSGVGINPQQAVNLYHRAAALGFTEAMKELSRCYANGIGVKADKAAAAEFLKRSLQ